MKIIITLLLIISSTFLFSCNKDNKEIIDEELTQSIVEINKELANSDIEITDEQKAKYEIFEPIINSIDRNVEDINIEKIVSKTLDIKFYSQFPLDVSSWEKYNKFYENYCEESSLLNWYYFLQNVTPSKDEYISDLNKLKEIENKLFWEGWYKHTSIQQSLLTLLFFQNDKKYLNEFIEAQSQKEKGEIVWDIIQITAKNNWIGWTIIFKPSIEDIEESINNWNPLVIPLFWKWLNNSLFNNWWPIYHNFLLKWFSKDHYVTNEVGITKWDSYKYTKKEIIDNIHDYYPDLYPEKFEVWEPRILSLFKYSDFNLSKVDYLEEFFHKSMEEDFKNSWFETIENFKDKRSMIDYYVGVKIEVLFKDEFDNLENQDKESLAFMYDEKILKAKIEGIYDLIWVPNILRNYRKGDYIIQDKMNLNLLIDFKY